MPLVTQSDPDPALARTLQHKFKGQHRNIKPEIFWSQLRHR
ncbi:hypothetical protein AZE42_13812 [Rhizopogon vesiculosus]|uniref:Uncharacterized protein n=1 Tax=Rhizopogon vesiculosus TaxID=180088 RepID=A0A1J8Q046_9AGAM|nr:hypothetical protein AZE42_13812 [Rhizopogon vesiculosus]